MINNSTESNELNEIRRVIANFVEVSGQTSAIKVNIEMETRNDIFQKPFLAILVKLKVFKQFMSTILVYNVYKYLQWQLSIINAFISIVLNRIFNFVHNV